MPLTIQQIADILELQFTGDPHLELVNVASLGSAGSGDICFLTHTKDYKKARRSNCSALIVPVDFTDELFEGGLVYSPNPHLSFLSVIELLRPHSGPQLKAGIDRSASIASTAELADDVYVGPMAVIGDGVKIGPRCQIGAGCIIEDQVKVGTACYLHSRVTLMRGVEIGNRCIFHSGTVIGSDGFGLIEDEGKWIKVPQIGSVIVGDDVEIGANTTVDRGALDDTVIEQGCKLDNLIQVAHNVRIGANTAIAACVGIAGSAIIGQHCKIGGAAVILGHLSVADNVMVTAMSLVTKDIKQAGVYSSGTPLMENSEWHKANVRYKSLDSLARKINQMNKQFG